MRKINTILYSVMAVAMAMAVPAQLPAQKVGNGGICVKEMKAKKEGRQVSVEMAFDLDSLQLSSNRYVTLTPYIADGADTLYLRPVIVSGRRQHIVYNRERRYNPEYTGIEEVLFRPGKHQVVPYRNKVPYEKWMHGATLSVAEEWCGCCGYAEENSETDLMRLNLLPAVYQVKPLLAYVEPKTETVKSRSESGEAFLDFRVNRTDIDPAYRGNPGELSKIRETIDKVRNDKDLTIRHITIHGYASPEGNYANNSRLAAGRTEALKNYVRGLYHFDDKLIDVSSTPEDWEGLRKKVVASDLTDKERLLVIIADTAKDPDVRERLLRNVGDGSAYRFMLQEWFPALRHSDYTIHYTVRGFDVEEAKQVIKTRPQKLSLHEMFAVAGQYAPGSEDFNQVFDVAVRMFPEDPTANLNAANIAIMDGVYDKAEAYLQKAGDMPEAIHSRGVLALLKGDYDRARTLLEKAGDLGIAAAEHNLQELDNKIENNKLFLN